jgi:NAD(P)-dependent dehydrogenase (short-subunit alcohol dehydrogenase family)
MTIAPTSFPPDGLAIVIGASGGIGAALADQIRASDTFAQILPLSRSVDGLDLTDEDSIARAAKSALGMGLPIRLVIVATGILHNDQMRPEKSWKQLDAATLAANFAINAAGPALVAKHFLPLLPRSGKAVFAALSAKVGSIGDNHLGGWYGYRAAKAALNQLIHTAAIELRRTHPEAVCLTLHPGSVATPLSAPFSSPAHPAEEPSAAAARLLAVVEQIRPIDSGLMLDYTGSPLSW